MLNSSKGYSYIWILLIVVAGAFFFAGGQFILEDLNQSMAPSPTPTPILILPTLPQGVATVTPTPTTLPSVCTWQITNMTTVCRPGGTASVNITTNTSGPGYIMLGIRNSAGNYTPVLTQGMSAASPNTTLPLTSADPPSESWRVILYEGGNQSPAGQYSGGNKCGNTQDIPPVTCI